MSGRSKLRNRTIANILSQMGFVEAWGTGIRRIREAAGNYGLPTPEISVFDNMFRVNLYRGVVSEIQADEKASEKHRRNIGEASEKHRRKNREYLQQR